MKKLLSKFAFRQGRISNEIAARTKGSEIPPTRSEMTVIIRELNEASNAEPPPPKANRVVRLADVPDDWADRILTLWEEDDAYPPDRETTSDAFERISGRKYQDANTVKRHDGGDRTASLFRGGWVVGKFPEGGFVGVLIK